jgi:hypothetical protein
VLAAVSGGDYSPRRVIRRRVETRIARGHGLGEWLGPQRITGRREAQQHLRAKNITELRGKDKVMIINPKTKPVVEYLFKNYDPIMKEGTFAALSRRVAKDFDIPNKLTPSGIRRILLNKYYIGRVVHGDMEVDGDHETFISKNRFNKVGRLIRRNVG